MAKEKKLVSNLLTDIGKVRDILDEGDFVKIERNTFFIIKTSNDVIRHVKKYIQRDTHQTDFNFEDVRALADGLHKLSDKCIKMRYNNMLKILSQKEPIEMSDFEALCGKLHKTNYFDEKLRLVANDLSLWALTMYLWSQSEYRKPIMEQLEDCLRSFL